MNESESLTTLVGGALGGIELLGFSRPERVGGDVGLLDSIGFLRTPYH